MASVRPHPPGHLTARDFRDDHEKWFFLRKAPELDARIDARVRRLAVHLWDASGHAPRAFLALAQAYCRDVIRYVTDTDQYGGEDIAPAGRIGDAIDSGADDCDAKARLFVALCLAVRLHAEMVPHWSKDENGADDLSHVSAEVDLEGKKVPVELTLSRARLGEIPKDVPRETTGHWALNAPL